MNILAEFFKAKKPVVIANKNKKQHRIDDTVKITFTGQDVCDRNKYYCQIEDEIGGSGFIYIKDIMIFNFIIIVIFFNTYIIFFKCSYFR